MPDAILLRVRVFALVVVVTIVGRNAVAVEGTEAVEPRYDRGPHVVETKLLDWRDEKRDREVPAKVYLPRDLQAPAPVIVFSHGLGGSRNGYAYLGEHWASRGYVSVHLQHAGSDDSLTAGDREGVRGRLERAGNDPLTAMQRPGDVSFAIDQLERLNAEQGEFEKKLDLKHLGMAGHSFGAWTTMAVVGQKAVLPGGRTFSMADPRITAAIAMSSPTPRAGSDLEKAYGSVTIPVFHMTGTLDDMPIGNSLAIDRRIPFDHTPARDQLLLILTGGDHMVFSGRVNRPGNTRLNAKGMTGDGKLDAGFQQLIAVSTAAFWDAFLKGDAAAKSWLVDGDFTKRLGTSGTFKWK
jgi:dienelactone hydrolase